MNKHDLPYGAVSLNELKEKGFDSDGKWAGNTLNFSGFMHRPEGDYFPPVRTELPQKSQKNSPPTSDYILMPRANTYALGLQALRDQCIAEKNQHHPACMVNGEKIYRPFEFKENIEARVNDYERHKPTAERLRLFNIWLDSCDGIAYQHKTGKFKLVPKSPDLITLPSNFKDSYKPINYAQIQGQEFDRTKVKYNCLLTKDEVMQHPVLLALLGYKALLRTYRDIVFAEKRADTAMGFWLLDTTPPQDQLRAVYVDILNYDSNAGSNCNLDNLACFLRRSP